MSNYYGKQPSSRPVFTTTSTATMTKAGAEIYQVRVFSGAAANFGIGDSSSTASISVFVPIGTTLVGEYFTISPGQWYLPGPSVTVTEMS